MSTARRYPGSRYREANRLREQRYRAAASDGYVRRAFFAGIPAAAVPQPLVDVARLLILLKREIWRQRKEGGRGHQ